jgi:arylsulfatase A-like enzyme
LAETGAVFRNAIAQWTSTNPSHISMFTGLYPTTHGVGTNTAGLSGKRSTLAQVLRNAGFRTGAFVSGYTLRSRRTGIHRGFEVYQQGFQGSRRDGRETADLALDWLAGLQAQERWFLFLHLYDAHGPYRGDGRYLHLFVSPDRGPRLKFIPKYQGRRDRDGNLLRHLNDYVDRYDAEIRYQDEVMGDLLRAVDLDSTVVVVVSDHGETLAERSKSLNLSHATGVFDEQIRIPFVFHSPDLEPGEFQEIVETVDILPTVLELLEVAPPPGKEIQGESLVPLLRGLRPERPDSLGFSGIWARKHNQSVIRLDKNRTVGSLRSHRWKLVVYPGLEEDYVHLFDLAQDPLERQDVAEYHPEIRDRLLARLEALQSQEADLAVERELTAEDVKNLQALGYLD